MEEGKNIFHSTLSVKEISSIFFKIDEQILDLHNCSSDDFLGLNSDFKKYYKQSRIISENADEIFRSLTEGGSGDLFRELQNLYKGLKTAQDHFVNHLNISLSSIKSITSSLDLFFLPLKNLNQDLMTLKFLLANFNLSSSNSSEEPLYNDESLILAINQIINSLKKCSLENDANISNIRDEASKNVKIIEEILNKTQTDLDSVLNNIHFSIIHFAEKYEETNRQIPELTQKTNRTSQSIADIITNLQFHDIIRQKIEHIQETHKSVLLELEQFGETIERSETDKQAKLLLKVRDIAGLQANVLVKANKEYQQAIEKITNEFLAIGNDMTGISMLCQKISKTNENSEELHLTEMLQKLQDSAIILSYFITAGDVFTVNVEKLANSINGTTQGITCFSELSNQLNSATASAIQVFSNKKIGEHNSNDILSQFVSVNDDIRGFEKEIIKNFNIISNHKVEISNTLSLYNKSSESQRYFGQAADSMNLLLSKLKERSERIQQILNENLDQSNSISSGVKESIKKIRYYDLFETNIVDIIKELNSIHKKISGEIREESEKEENLKSIKDLYTMESEHHIHNKVVNADNEIDVFKSSDIIVGNEDNSNDDEVELF